MSTIKALYEDAIQYEESVLAHYIFCLLQEGKIDLHDDESVLFQVQPDSKKLKEMIETNLLGFCEIKLYSLKVGRKKWALIFANSPEEAKFFLWKTTGQKPLNCHERSMDLEVFNGSRFLNFRELKKELSQFPSLVGYY